VKLAEMDERTDLSGHTSRQTGQPGSRRRGRQVALLLVIGAAIAAVGCGVVSCGEDEPTTDATPTVTVKVTPTVQPSPAAEGETPETPATLEAEDDYAGWLTYTNDVYGYEFRYPSGAEVAETPIGGFRLPAEEYEAGVTFEDAYDLHTGKVCVTVSYEFGYINISAPPNEGFRYVICGRTGRAYEGPDREDSLLIDGTTYTAGGFEEQGPGETLNYHNETLILTLDDGTRIEYGAGPSETATFEDYLLIRDDLLRIVQSYHKLP